MDAKKKRRTFRLVGKRSLTACELQKTASAEQRTKRKKAAVSNTSNSNASEQLTLWSLQGAMPKRSKKKSPTE